MSTGKFACLRARAQLPRLFANVGLGDTDWVARDGDPELKRRSPIRWYRSPICEEALSDRPVTLSDQRVAGVLRKARHGPGFSEGLDAGDTPFRYDTSAILRKLSANSLDEYWN